MALRLCAPITAVKSAQAFLFAQALDGFEVEQ
jgi:hypothetical protein